MTHLEEKPTMLVLSQGMSSNLTALHQENVWRQVTQTLQQEEIDLVLVTDEPIDTRILSGQCISCCQADLTLEYLENILLTVRPTVILPLFLEQKGVNLLEEMSSRPIWQSMQPKLLGTQLPYLQNLRDRKNWSHRFSHIGIQVLPSYPVTSKEEIRSRAEDIGFPVLLRTRDSSGQENSFLSNSFRELHRSIEGLERLDHASLEPSIAGWKEVSLVLLRDHSDQVIVVGSMESLDPVGIHFRDSLAVLPIQTLSDRFYQVLREDSIRFMRSLRIVGPCHLQVAVDPTHQSYYVIDVQPFLTDAALTMEMTSAYPLRSVAMQVLLGQSLDQISLPQAEGISAMMEPVLDHVTMSVPLFSMESASSRVLGPCAQVHGQVLGLGSTLLEAMNKGLQALSLQGPFKLEKLTEISEDQLLDELVHGTTSRWPSLLEALRRGYSVEELASLTKIDPYFLQTLKDLVEREKALVQGAGQPQALYQAKRAGFSDRQIAQSWQWTERAVRQWRKSMKLTPVYRGIDPFAGVISYQSSRFYAGYGRPQEVSQMSPPGILQVGPGEAGPEDVAISTEENRGQETVLTLTSQPELDPPLTILGAENSESILDLHDLWPQMAVYLSNRLDCPSSLRQELQEWEVD